MGESKETEESKYESVEGCEVIDNDIFFYTDIDDDSVLWLNKQLTILEKKLLIQTIECPGYKPYIRLFIKSDGGDIFAGVSAMDHIANIKVSVVTIADGLCASAATFLLLGGTKRLIKKHAFVLIHQLSTEGFWGKFEEVKDEMKTLKKFMAMIHGIYEVKTKIPQKKMNKLMKKDIYLSAEQCLKYDIVDEVF